jgi:exopolysaccharide/PEP-CTERM locus tyrosine autokinase
MSGFIDQRLLDTYNLLRTQILHKTREQRWNAIMVTSAVPGEGKTTLAVNLGLSIASEAMQTALVVDMNLRSPKVDTLLDLQCQHGLSDYLLDGAELSDLLVNPNHDNFVVLPAGKTVEGSTDILGSVRMKELVQELKHRYPDRYVIFDCPHILDMPDALIFASYVDAVMLVVEAGKTSHDHVQKALEMLNDNNVIGLVLNKIITG